MLPGGKGGNVAFQLAALGVATQLVGSVGNDTNATLALSELERIGVDMSGVSRDGQKNTGIAIAVTPKEV